MFSIEEILELTQEMLAEQQEELAQQETPELTEDDAE